MKNLGVFMVSCLLIVSGMATTAAADVGTLENAVSVDENGDFPTGFERQGLLFPDFKNAIVVSFFKLPKSDDNVYVAFYDSSILQFYRFNDDRSFRLFSKSLTHWSGELSPGFKALYAPLGMTQENIDEDWNYHYETVEGSVGMGCLHANPLRYGDVDQDGTNELALFVGDIPKEYLEGSLDFVMFSPEKKKIIFSVRTARVDVSENLAEQYDPDSSEGVQASDPQYESGISGKWIAPATQVYAKIYMGDFDNDDNKDILVWRKRYESRKISDPVKGFKLTKQLYNHYELVDGEYQLQDTDQVTIKGWLTDHNLTWQKGFPSESECKGEEGKPIPEMSDPLLNDPDVLK